VRSGRTGIRCTGVSNGRAPGKRAGVSGTMPISRTLLAVSLGTDSDQEGERDGLEAAISAAAAPVSPRVIFRSKAGKVEFEDLRECVVEGVEVASGWNVDVVSSRGWK